ncbi:Isoprenyl transferase [Candidatus Rubidus massiliensis]|nr:MAG: di-trans,poly-cis-decaprenylcistransferase [Chlamydia sp. 32-24]CDZ79539.1 Isoprenyl transferase [Candidatus Rubidus massiliensis]
MSTNTFIPEIKYFTSEQLQALDPSRIPSHVAIIPDGNRRWAKQNQATTKEGHREGGNIIIDILRAAKEIGIKHVTFYVFSTENNFRPKEEVDALMWLLYNYFIEERQTMIDNGVKLHAIGEISKLPEYVLEALQETIKATSQSTDIDCILALNYGSRNEITRSFKKIARALQAKELFIDDINETVISNYLDTAPWPDPDLLIRTSGEARISNFLLWQISYAELHIVDTLWPEFAPVHLLEAIEIYQKRERRLGRI